MTWLILQSGPGEWRYLNAGPPCNKGEVRASFRWFNLTLGWERSEARPAKASSSLTGRKEYLDVTKSDDPN